MLTGRAYFMFVPRKWFFANRLNLWGLVSLRILVLSLQIITVVICYIYKLFYLPWGILALTFFFSALLCVLTVIRLVYIPKSITDFEYASQLLCDLTLQCVLLYCTGGLFNPFASYFLVPITIAAVTLPWFYTFALVIYAIFSYSFLWAFHLTLEAQEIWSTNQEILLNNLTLLGMWLSFAFSTVLIGFFVSQMASSLRQQDKKIAEWREDGLHDQQLLAVAAQAAGAAHELSTPLSTMSVLLKELQDTYKDKLLQDDLALLQGQVQSCKESLQQLVRAAEAERLNDIKLQSVTFWLNTILQRWHLMRPEVSYHYTCLGKKNNEPSFKPHTTLSQALLNILNNAADACPEDIQIELSWDKSDFSVKVHDKGSGISAVIARDMTKPFVSTKSKGFGLGLYLSQASVNRAGGSLKLYNDKVQGTVAVLTLPCVNINS